MGVLTRTARNLLVSLALEATMYQAVILSGAITPEPIGTYTPPDAGMLGPVYYNYGLLGPEFTYWMTAVEFLVVGLVAGLLVTIVLEVHRWYRHRQRTRSQLHQEASA